MPTAKNVANNAATGATVGSAFGPIGTGIGAVLGGVSSFIGKSGKNSAKAAAQQYEYNLALQKQAQEWNEYMYKHRYQFQREDLENAGINPLFGMGQAPSVTSGTNSVGMADYVGEQNNKFQQLMGLLDFGQNLSAKRAQTKLLENQANTEEQNTLLRTAQVTEQLLKNENLTKQQRAEYEKTLAETYNLLADSQKKQAEKNYIDAGTARTKLENKPLERYEEIARKNPELIKIIENIDKTGMTGKAFLGILKQGGNGLRLLLNR